MSERPAEAFGALLRTFRLAVGVTQETLAERARISAATVSALERGFRRAPYRDTVEFLAAALELGPQDRARFAAAAARPRMPRGRPGGPDEVAATVDRQRHNLPLQLSSFVGRERELDEISAIVREHRLVTLTGAGGIGKTSTALEVGSIRLGTDPGVWLVELAPLQDASLVAATIARALEIQESPNRPVLETIVRYLKQKTLMLIIDNCEHVVAEAARIADTILRACPAVRILATSREPLSIRGERSYRLPSLAFPTPEATRALRADEINEYSAVALFVERALAVDRGFILTDENAPTVAEICKRLDGIPLAIELAAARVTMLPIKALLNKLDQRFVMLSGGDRTAPRRHQTMRALIDWSYDLLSPEEQSLFETLSVFAGGWSLGAATVVFGGPELEIGYSLQHSTPAGEAAKAIDVFECLSSLVDKSLVIAEFTSCEPRYRMLESFREYAREKLEMRGKSGVVAHRHALACLDLAQQFQRAYVISPGRKWLAQAEVELENWLVALEWGLGGFGDLVVGHRLVAALHPVWIRLALAEGQRRVQSALALINAQNDTLADIAQLEYVHADMALRLGDLKIALAAGIRALEAYRQLRDPLGTARSQCVVGLSLARLGESAEGGAVLREALKTAQALNDRILVGTSFMCIAHAHSAGDDVRAARVYFAKALAIFRASGAEFDAASVAINLAEAEFRAGYADTAVRISAEVLPIAYALHQRLWVAALHHNMAAYLVTLARFDEAHAHAVKALDLAGQLQIEVLVLWTLQHLAAVAALRTKKQINRQACDGYAPAARLLGFTVARFAVLGTPQEHTERQEYDRVLEVLREAIGADLLGELMAGGATMTEEEAIEEAARI